MPTASLRCRPLLTLTIVAVSSLVLLVHGQVAGAGPDTKHNSDATGVTFGASIPDSPAAMDLLQDAALEEAQKHWDKSAELLMQAATQFPGKVVPRVRDGSPDADYFVDIADVVQERIAHWPQDGITAYQTTYGPVADDLLKHSKRDDLTAQAEVFWTYFPTDAGKTAGVRLMDAYLERGSFAAAAWLGNRLLHLHPALGDDRPMVIYRTALAYHFGGNQQQAQDCLATLAKDDPDSAGNIAGKDVRLVDSLSTALGIPAPTADILPTDADTYPGMGGAGSSGEISRSAAKLGSDNAVFRLAPPKYPPLTARQLDPLTNADRDSLANNLSLAIIPAVDHGDLFFQDGRSLYAINELTHAPLSGWLGTYPGDQAGQYCIETMGRARGELLTVAVSPKAVLAVMGQPDRLMLQALSNEKSIGSQTPEGSTQRLVCLQRDTGRPAWVATPAGLPESAGAVRNCDYDGTPLIISGGCTGRGPADLADDEVVVTARAGKHNDFDDCYVVGLSLKSGRYLWSTYVGSATQNEQVQGNPSQITYADERIFVMTNLGTVAAIEPLTGRLLWLRTYDRATLSGSLKNVSKILHHEQRVLGLSAASPWTRNPVVFDHGNVFALPNDATSLFVFDAQTGDDRGVLPMHGLDNAEILLGVQSDRVFLNSEKKVFAVNWRKYAQIADLVQATEWAADVSFIDGATVSGRGCIAGDSIFMPTTQRLVQLRNGRITATYPKRGALPADQRPGSLLATEHAIVSAGGALLRVFYFAP